MLKKVLRILLIALVALLGLALFQHFYGGVPGDVPPKATFEILAAPGRASKLSEGCLRCRDRLRGHPHL
jgi:hypothetical protein